MRGGPLSILLALVIVLHTASAAEPVEEWGQSLTGRIVDVDLTPTGRAVVATADGLVTFTDATGKALQSAGFATPSLRIASDGLKVAVGRTSNAALIDNAGRTLWEKPMGGTVTGVGMDRSGQRIAAGADDKYVYLFDASGTQTARVPVEEVPSGVAVAGGRVAVGLPSGKLLLLDAEGKTLWEASAGSPVHGVDLSSANVAAAAESGLVLFSLAGEKLWSLDLGSPARAVAASDDGSLVLAAAQAGDAILYNAKGEFLWKLKPPAGGSFTAVGLSPGGSWAAVGSREAGVKVYKSNVSEAKAEGAAAPVATATPAPTPTPRTESELVSQSVPTPSRVVLQAPGALQPAWTKSQQTISGSPADVTRAVVSPDGAAIAMVSPKGLYFLDRAGSTLTSANPFSAIISLKLLQFEVSRDGQQLRISGCESTGGTKVDAIYSVKGSQVWLINSTAPSCIVGGVRVAADGSSAINLSGDGTFLTWLDANLQPRATHNRTSLSAGVQKFDLSPDGKHAAVSYGNRTVELFDSATGLRVAKDDPFLFSVDDLRFTPDGELAVRAGPDVFLLNPASVSAAQNIEVVWKRRVESVLSWDVGEDSFAAGTKNNEIVWAKGGEDIVHGKVDGFVDSVALSANGRFLAASSSQAFKVWLYADDGQRLWEAEVSQPTGVSVANDGSVLVYANPSGATTKAGALHLFTLPTLDLDSTPAGARVTVDGFDYGTTPVRIQGLKPGNRSVTVSLEGYDDCTGTVSVSGTTQRLCILVALPGGSPPPSTPTPSPSPEAAASPSPAPAAPSPEATPAPSPSPSPRATPGFELVLALAALGAVAVALRRRPAGVRRRKI